MSDDYFNKGPDQPEYSRQPPSPDPSPVKTPPAKKSFLGMSPVVRKRIIITMVSIVLVAGLAYFIYLIMGLPDLTDLENVNPAQATQIYSADGKVIHELFTYSRVWLPFEKIPDHVVEATLATEDRVFYDHWGIHLKRIIKPIIVNLLSMSYQEGFSTISMQVARNLYVKKIGFEQSITRKLREILTALQVERTYSKQEILEMYLNLSYFGEGSVGAFYGIQNAAKNYFNKDANELTIDEGAFLIGVLKGPSNYSPKRHPERALARRNLVLYNMKICDYLAPTVYDSLKALPIVTNEWQNKGVVAPYFTEYVRQQLNAKQEELDINVYEDGLNVYTTLNTMHQAVIDSTIKKQLPIVQERVTKSLQPWKKKYEVSDSTFAEKSKVQIAFMAVDHSNGHILAMVGGRDFDESKFNRAVQAKRQPGSTFKPFLYATALDNGWTPVDKLINQPVVLTNPDGTRWTPENFDRTFGGLTTLREGLKRSLNLIASRLILEIGPRNVADYAKRIGISTEVRPYPSLAMGSSDVILKDMVTSFGVFANQGVRVEPVAILRIEDRHGNVLWEHRPNRVEVLNRSTAYILSDMLEDVINLGTGGSTRWKWKFQAPAAGKTGTTNDYSDAWFMGFTPRLTAGVWVGLDDHMLKLGRLGTGSETALPFWAQFMKTIYDTLDIPQEKFIQPPGIITLNICNESGEVATNFCPNVINNEVFKSDSHPAESCPLHPGVTSKKRYKVVY